MTTYRPPRHPPRSLAGVVLLAATALACRTAVAEPPAAPAEVVARGTALYTQHCQACHGDRAGVGRVASAPLHGPEGHTWHHSDRNLLEIILDGSGPAEDKLRDIRGVAPDAPRMPGWRGVLTEADAAAVLASIKTWWLPEQRSFQAKVPYQSPPGWQQRQQGGG